MTFTSLLQGREIPSGSSTDMHPLLSRTVGDLWKISQAGREAWPAQCGRSRGSRKSLAIYWGFVGPGAANLIAAKPCYCIPAQNVI